MDLEEVDQALETYLEVKEEDLVDSQEGVTNATSLDIKHGNVMKVRPLLHMEEKERLNWYKKRIMRV